MRALAYQLVSLVVSGYIQTPLTTCKGVSTPVAGYSDPIDPLRPGLDYPLAARKRRRSGRTEYKLYKSFPLWRWLQLPTRRKTGNHSPNQSFTNGCPNLTSIFVGARGDVWMCAGVCVRLCGYRTWRFRFLGKSAPHVSFSTPSYVTILRKPVGTQANPK